MCTRIHISFSVNIATPYHNIFPWYLKLKIYGQKLIRRTATALAKNTLWYFPLNTGYFYAYTVSLRCWPHDVHMMLNPLVPGRYDSDFKSVIIRCGLRPSALDIDLRWMFLNTFDDNSIPIPDRLVSLGNRQLPGPMLTQIYVALYRHEATMC